MHCQLQQYQIVVVKAVAIISILKIAYLMSYRNYRVRKYMPRLHSLHSKYSSVEPFICAWSMLLIRSPRLPCLSNSTSVRSLRFRPPNVSADDR